MKYICDKCAWKDPEKVEKRHEGMWKWEGQQCVKCGTSDKLPFYEYHPTGKLKKYKDYRHLENHLASDEDVTRQELVAVRGMLDNIITLIENGQAKPRRW